MPRIRSIKPEFFDDPEIADLTIEERLVYIGLWTMCYDNWTMEYDPRRVRRTLFGYDTAITDAMVDSWVASIVRTKRGIFFGFDGKRCLYLPKCREHQVVNRPGKSPIDAPPLTDDSVSTHGALTEHSLLEGKGGVKEGKGDGGERESTPTPLHNFPQCLDQSVKMNGNERSLRGHILDRLEVERGAAWVMTQKNLGTFASRLKDGCIPGCEGGEDQSIACTVQMLGLINRCKRDATLYSALATDGRDRP